MRIGPVAMLTLPSSATFQALGTTVVLVVDDRAELHRAEVAVREVLERVDLACSRFRDDSELARLNAAPGSPVAVGPLLLRAVHAGGRAAAVTDGAVTPTIGRALIALGYDRDFAELEAAPPAPRPPRRSLAAVPGWQAVRIDLEASRVRLPQGVSLDLGATAKALAADLAAAEAHRATATGVLVSLGGDIAIAGPSPSAG